jgi:hypothetical protein
LRVSMGHPGKRKIPSKSEYRTREGIIGVQARTEKQSRAGLRPGALGRQSGDWRSRGWVGGEIEMVVVAARGVEGGGAMRADGIAFKIGGDREKGAAGAAEDGGLVPFGLRPGLEEMVGEGVVAVLAGVEKAAAFHFDGDDVEGGVIVEAAGLRVEI